MPVSASLLPTPANPIATPPYCTSSWRLEASRPRQVGFIVCSRQQQTDSPQKRVIEYFEQLLSGFVLPRSDFVSFHLEASKSLDLLLHFCASYGFAGEGDSAGMCGVCDCFFDECAEQRVLARWFVVRCCSVYVLAATVWSCCRHCSSLFSQSVVELALLPSKYLSVWNAKQAPPGGW